MSEGVVEDRRLEGMPGNEKVSESRFSKGRYTSRDFAELEARNLWPRVWQVACREEDVPEPGDHFLYRIIDQEVIVVRQTDGSIRALRNFCRHRGMPLIDGPGQRSEFRCSFHAWTYDLDGSLKFALSPDEFPCRPGDYSLVQIQTGRWGGFVFVNFDPAAPPLSQYLAPASAALDAYQFDKLVYKDIVTHEVPINWKFALEYFAEGYHTAGAHPQLLVSFDDVNTRYENHGLHNLMIVPALRPSPRYSGAPLTGADVIESLQAAMEDVALDSLSFDGLEFPPDFSVDDAFSLIVQLGRMAATQYGIETAALSDEAFTTFQSWWLFPNLLCQASPLEMMFWHALPNGRDPESCLMTQYVLGPRPTNGEAAPPVPRQFYKDWEHEKGLVLRQDLANMYRNQRGLHQEGFDGPLFAAVQESGLRNFHRTVEDYIFGNGTMR